MNDEQRKRTGGAGAGRCALARWIWTGIFVASLAGTPALAQMGGPPLLPPPAPPSVMGPGAKGRSQDPMLAQIEHRQALERNTERQKDLVNDTNKLLKLAQQLKTAVDKSNQDTLSIDVIKKANQIQKLAKSISSKMKGNY